MSNVYEFKPGAREHAIDASDRICELGDALRCIDKLMAGDEERLRLITNDLRGLMRVITREVDAISEEITALL